MKLTPIFDTSALLDLCRNDDSLDAIAKRLKPLIPSHGYPLSFVTVLELFRGLSNSDPDRVAETLKPLLLAARISRRDVLHAPLNFAAWELFQSSEAFRHRPKLLVEWLEKIQLPDFAAKFVAGEVKMDFEGTKQIFEKIEREQHQALEVMLDRWNPAWREDRTRGSALPEPLHEKAKRALQLDPMREALPELFLREMKIEPTPTNIEKARRHCDAYFTFQVNLNRDSIVGGYHFEANPNDFHDWIQFLYLTRSWFCLVTNDGPSLRRTEQSSQHSRIMTLAQFLSPKP